MADSEQDAVVLAVDISVDGWKVSEASEYRHVVGVNAEYALRKVQLSWNEAVEEMRAEFGEAMDADDWAPPKDYVPLVLLNIDPQYLLGFAWIAHRRTHPQDTFAAWADEIPVGQLNTAFYEAMSAMAQEA